MSEWTSVAPAGNETKEEKYIRLSKGLASLLDGETDVIRRQYGDNKVELIYTDEQGRHTEILSGGEEGAATLREMLDKQVTINSYRELIPRMNDIFIKLVSGK